MPQKTDQNEALQKASGFDQGILASTHSILISVVMPNYNGRESIERAIVSVLTQSHTQIQLVVVDDCSTDDSVSFLRQRFNDPRLHVRQIEQNNMIGAARNTGISMAAGEYLYFLDSDDFLLPNALENLLAIAEQSNADVVQGGTQRLEADGKVSIFHQSEFISDGGIEGLKRFSNGEFASVAWNKIYRRELFEAGSKIRFMENHMHEDVPFSMECSFKAKCIISTSTPVICYTENMKSVTQKPPTRLNVESYAAVYVKLAELCHTCDLYSSKGGIAIARKIIQFHGNDDIIRKLVRCRAQMGPAEFEEILCDVGFSMAGRYGMATASLIGGLTTLLHDAQQATPTPPTPKSKDPLRSIKRFMKKRYGHTR